MEGGSGTSPRSGPEALARRPGFLLAKVGFRAQQEFKARLRPLGIDAKHFALLTFLAGGEGHSQQALGSALGIDASTMVAIVDDLERRGLVERRPNPSDRRANAVELTPAGRRLLRRARRVAYETEEVLLAGIGAAERSRLIAILIRIAADDEVPLGVHPSLAEGSTPPRGARSRPAKRRGRAEPSARG